MTESDQGRQPDRDPGAPGTPPVPPSGWGPGYGGRPGYGQEPPAAHDPQYGSPQQGTPQYGAPQYGSPQQGTPQYGAPQYGAPQYGEPQQGTPPYGAPAGYRPAPVQRGIVPLRPLGLGEILDGAFRSIRDNPRVMFGVSAVVVSIAVLLQTVVQWYSYGFLGDSLVAPVSQDAELLLGDVVGMAGSSVLSGLVSLVATTILTGLLIISVSRSVIGQQVSLGEAWARARPQLWRLLGLTALVLLLLVSVPVVWLVGVAALGMGEQFGLLALTMFVGGVAVVVWLVWIGVRTLLATPALMLEEQGVIDGLRRGWRLSQGSFWRLLGIYLLTAVVAGAVAAFIIVPATILVAVLGLDPLANPLALIISGIASVVASVLTTPFVAAVTALLYIDLRIRREGLDVDLARAAETAAAGTGTSRP